MGFFSDLKEDLNQAVNELLPEGEKEAKQVSAEENETLQQLEELESMLQNIDEIQEQQVAMAAEQASQQAAEPVAQAAPAESVAETFAKLEKDVPEEASKAPEQITLAKEEEVPSETPIINKAPEMQVETVKEEKLQIFVEETAAPKKAESIFRQEETVVRKPEGDRALSGMEQPEDSGLKAIDKSWVLDLKSMEEMDETAVITAGMRVKGDILSNGSADIFGEVYGNVQVKGRLNVTGKIAGNSKGAEILADSAKINGDLISDGGIKIGVGTVVVGNVEATEAVIAGAVKGTIDVKGPVMIAETAVVLGNVKAKSIQINNGARIEGMCVLCYAEQSAAKFFEEQEA
ncbi:MAG: polymer-forming cytoskeletal protein [Lachnospiraceae bacterium]|nr:polymer-forming cytoskeletal protein [Lachnospiraceae bacterium]MBR4608361.1 polymer-forming cytoskeletal protein [Lachnospiraceae bacterium]